MYDVYGERVPQIRRHIMEMREKHEYCHDKVESHLYKIGLFAQMNHTIVKTLRFYEERGLYAG